MRFSGNRHVRQQLLYSHILLSDYKLQPSSGGCLNGRISSSSCNHHNVCVCSHIMIVCSRGIIAVFDRFIQVDFFLCTACGLILGYQHINCAITTVTYVLSVPAEFRLQTVCLHLALFYAADSVSSSSCTWNMLTKFRNSNHFPGASGHGRSHDFPRVGARRYAYVDKVIQGHQFWYQWKTRICDLLCVNNSNLRSILHLSEICWVIRPIFAVSRGCLTQSFCVNSWIQYCKICWLETRNISLSYDAKHISMS